MVSSSLTPPEYSLFCVCFTWHQMSLSNTFLFLFFRLIWFVVWKMCLFVCQFQKLAFYDEQMKVHKTFWLSVLLICVARLQVRNNLWFISVTRYEDATGCEATSLTDTAYTVYILRTSYLCFHLLLVTLRKLRHQHVIAGFVREFSITFYATL